MGGDDAENRLTNYNNSLTAGYRGDGLRAWRQGSGGRTYFLYDGNLPVLEMDASGNVTAMNLFGADGLVSRQSSSQGHVLYLLDPQGNVAQRLSSSGGVLTNALFSAHGARALSGSTDPDPWMGQGAQDGSYYDPETGLVLMTHRYYDRETGRFLTRDPIGYSGGINLYGYTGSVRSGKLHPQERAQIRSAADARAVRTCVETVQGCPVARRGAWPPPYGAGRAWDCAPCRETTSPAGDHTPCREALGFYTGSNTTAADRSSK